MLKLPIFALAIATGLLITTNEQVKAFTMTNGSFETGNFSNWTTIGQATVEDSAFGTAPGDGNYQAILETLQDNTGVSSADLENFLGLSSGSLTGLGAIEGSAIKQTITVKAGDILKFSGNFLTDQDPLDATYNDFAFFTLNNSLNQIADTNSFSNLSFSRLLKETGYQSYTYNFQAAGTYNLGFGVVDVGDSTVNSALVVDNIKVVPEPTTMLGTLIALGFGSVYKRRFAKK